MKEVEFGEKFFCYCMACKENKGNGRHGELKLSMPVIHDFRYHIKVDSRTKRSSLLKIGPDWKKAGADLVRTITSLFII